ncbi:unnamed protein product [Closterium sp. NIES-65]|nr:unnamed protein product [Closterium sp. NIES-65]
MSVPPSTSSPSQLTFESTQKTCMSVPPSTSSPSQLTFESTQKTCMSVPPSTSSPSQLTFESTQTTCMSARMMEQVEQKEVLRQRAQHAKEQLRSGEWRKAQDEQANMQRFFGSVDWREQKKLRMEKKKLERTVHAGNELAKLDAHCVPVFMATRSLHLTPVNPFSTSLNTSETGAHSACGQQVSKAGGEGSCEDGRLPRCDVIPFHSVAILSIPFHSIAILSIPFHSIAILSIPFHSIAILSIPFHSIAILSIPFHSIAILSIPFHSIAILSIPFHPSHSCHGIRPTPFHRFPLLSTLHFPSPPPFRLTAGSALVRGTATGGVEGSSHPRDTNGIRFTPFYSVPLHSTPSLSSCILSWTPSVSHSWLLFLAPLPPRPPLPFLPESLLSSLLSSLPPFPPSPEDLVIATAHAGGGEGGGGGKSGRGKAGEGEGGGRGRRGRGEVRKEGRRGRGKAGEGGSREGGWDGEGCGCGEGKVEEGDASD